MAERSERVAPFRATHRAPELLAPAGGPDPFNAALAAGADAIYCGLGTDFNARRGARNFDDETFAAACRAAHLAGARVYVTENVVIRTDEMPAALALVRRAWLLGADAFIIQDWGLLAEVRRLWPQIECHVSTQANVHDARGVAWCRELGVDRVTLSRELSVAEIARIAEEGVELEGFGHGAALAGIEALVLPVGRLQRPRLGQGGEAVFVLPVVPAFEICQGKIHMGGVVGDPADAVGLLFHGMPRAAARALRLLRFVKRTQQQHQKAHVIGERHARPLPEAALQAPAQTAVNGLVAAQLLRFQHAVGGDQIPEHQLFPVNVLPHLRQTILIFPCPRGTRSVVLQDGQV